MSEETSSRRRRFLNWFLGTSAGALAASFLYPVLRYLSPPSVPEAETHEVEAGPTNDPELLERGFKILRFGAEPVILIRVSDTDFRALTATCTHLDCIVEFHRPEQAIVCNCHAGQYDLSGRAVSGPPPKPLTPLKVHVVARGPGQPGTLVVSRG
jgi:cytochrome b6-f complex iron-sulfur subunit